MKLLSGFLSLVASHIGVGLGALYIGTAGILLCYVAGFWLLIHTLRQDSGQSKSQK